MASSERTYNRSLTAPATDAFAIAPNDGADFARPARAIYVGSGGDLALVTMAGSQVLFSSLNAGTILPVSATRVRATGTTATGLVGLL